MLCCAVLQQVAACDHVGVGGAADAAVPDMVGVLLLEDICRVGRKDQVSLAGHGHMSLM